MSWIDVNLQKPPAGKKVLLNVVKRKNWKPVVCIGSYWIEPDEDPEFILDDEWSILKGVTHWQPLPDPFKEPQQ